MGCPGESVQCRVINTGLQRAVRPQHPASSSALGADEVSQASLRAAQREASGGGLGAPDSAGRMCEQAVHKNAL